MCFTSFQNLCVTICHFNIFDFPKKLVMYFTRILCDKKYYVRQFVITDVIASISTVIKK